MYQLPKRLLQQERKQRTRSLGLPTTPVGILAPMISAETYRAERERHGWPPMIAGAKKKPASTRGRAA
jgi:hypothetical protein